MKHTKSDEPSLWGARIEDFHQMFYRMKKNTLSIVGLGVVLALVSLAVLAPYLAPYPEDAGKTIHMDRIFQPPSLSHPAGTDEMGRDMLSRLLFGSRVSLTIGLSVVALAILVGAPLGMIAGYVGGKTKAIIMMVCDVFLAVPSLALALAASAALGPSLDKCIFAIALVWWPWYARLAQGEVLSARQQEYVEASRAVGAGALHVTFKEIMPNILSPIIVKSTLDIGIAILTAAALGFLGIGAQPPTPEWGTMINEARKYLPGMWWGATFPGLFIFVAVLGFNLFGDGLRDALKVEV